MPPSDQVGDDLVDAILEGSPIDWAAVESSSEGARRPLLRQLKIVSAVAVLARSDHARTSPVLWGHLRLVERIGQGAFGEVYRARDTRLDREVALKLLPADRSVGDRTASAIIHEGRLLARVRHPNVVTIYGAEQISDQIGLWMEFVRGKTLEQILGERKVVSAAEAVNIGLELCRAVSAVHYAGLLHRDIKTHNVMRAEDGRIVLMDFGTGPELEDDESSDLAGTPLYLAPEVLQGQPATVHSDIYSLGVLLYRLVTGTYPVHAQTIRGVSQAHERGERTSVQAARRDTPSKLARIIERAVDPQPERRYHSADALRADLATLTPRARLVRLPYAAGVTGVLILVGAVGWELRGRQAGLSTTPSALLARFVGSSTVTGAAVSPTGQPIIAVLPLKSLSTEPEGDYFVDGLTDEIIRNLAVVQGLQVRSRTSSFAFKDKPRNLREVGQQLGANLVVEGSVLRSGNKLRVNAQLFRIAGEVPLWAERFDRDLNSSSDVFIVLDEISRAIVNRLRLTLARGQRRYNIDLQAYELYLKARALNDRRGVSNAEKAAELFQQVIAKDPTFAPAHAGLANAYAWMSPGGSLSLALETAISIMRPAAVKAVELDPLLAEAHAAMGWVYSWEFAWENAEKSFQRAIDLDPSLAQSYTSYSISTLQPLEKFDEALRILRVALRNDPLSLDVQREIGLVQLFAGQYAEAIDTFQRVLAVDPDFPYVENNYARALMYAGRLGEAVPLLEKADSRYRYLRRQEQIGRSGREEIGRRVAAGKIRQNPWLALAYVRTGRRAEAETLAEQHGDSPETVAVISAALGHKDRAFEALERAAIVRPHGVARTLINPEMAVLHGDPRLAALRKRFNLP